MSRSLSVTLFEHLRFLLREKSLPSRYFVSCDKVKHKGYAAWRKWAFLKQIEHPAAVIADASYGQINVSTGRKGVDAWTCQS